MDPCGEPRFQIQEQVYVEPTASSPGFHTIVLGLKVSHCLILEHPFEGMGAHRLKAGDVLWIRCFKEKVVRFRARVLRVLREPLPMLIVEYPKTVEEIDLRGSERKKVFLRGAFLDLKERRSDRAWEGYILDISETGCLMWGEFVHLVDRDVLLSFRIPWTGELIKAKAKVVRCEVTDKGVRSGLKFLEMDESTKEKIKAFMKVLDERTDVAKLISESRT
jgi:c-di-GMP-binding flagellar brake protein YcgR